MSTPEMHFSDKMDIAMKTIWYLRSSTGKTKLSQMDVERESALFDETGNGVSRQNWLKSTASAEWRAIRDAIDGNLSPSHPVEKRIAEFADGDKAGRFLAQIQKLDLECVSLRQQVKVAEEKYAQLEKTVLEQQYVSDYDAIHLQKLRKDLDNRTKELNVITKILNAAQTEVDHLRSENEMLRKNIGVQVAVEKAKYRIVEPQVSSLLDVADDELLTAYLKQVKETSKSLLLQLQRPPRQNDVVIIFHAFNTDLPTFVRQWVPFRHPEGNVVFACCQPISESRRILYDDVAACMDPIKPRVFIVAGGTLRQTDVNRVAKVVNIGQKPGDAAINERLRQALAVGVRKPEYDLVDEGFEDVRIVRVANG